MWKIITPRLTTLFMDQISEHQRDLTSSASARTYGEIIAYAVTATKRLTGTLNKLSVDQHRMSENLAYEQDLITAEPLYIILSTLGHQDAHEKVRTLSLEARKQRCSLQKIVEQDSELAPYRARMSDKQVSVLHNPQRYVGSSARKALPIADHWQKRLNLTSE
jgi:adenylosuccinate lyase